MDRSISDSLRVAFINSWYRDPARGSGTAVAIQGLATGMRSLGHEVVLVEPGRDRGAGLRQRLAFNLTAGRRLRGGRHALVVGFDIDGVFLSRGVAGRYVVSLKGVAADERRFERGAARMSLWATSVLEGRNARRAGRVIVTSRYARGRALMAYGLPEHKVRVVPEGIPFDFWSAARDRDDAHPATIVSVARFYPRKNLAALVAAMPAVRAAVPRARLRLVGGGPEEESLRRQAVAIGLHDAVEFPGALADRALVRHEYRTATVFCLPSLQEGFGIAFLEAMASGLPIVGIRAAAVPEVVPDGEVGYLVPPHDSVALADALIRLLRDASLRSRLGDAGRARAAGYDWPRVATRFLEAALLDGDEP